MGSLLIAGRNRAPLLEPSPEPLHVVAIGEDPVRAGDLVLVALRGDGRASPQVPDVLAKRRGCSSLGPPPPPTSAPRASGRGAGRPAAVMGSARSQDEGHRPSGAHLACINAKPWSHTLHASWLSASRVSRSWELPLRGRPGRLLAAPGRRVLSRKSSSQVGHPHAPGPDVVACVLRTPRRAAADEGREAAR